MCAVRFDMSSSFSPEYVKRLADLARLAMPEAEIAQAAERLQRIDAYVQMLRSSDLLGEEPLVHVGELANVLGADEPGAALSREALEALAPAMLGEFLSVPKVIDEGGGA
jgi:aspartyl-tRNA(Asn)/glutamyl-tRNA(Gln) amidotransferase subunit C